MRAAAGIVLLTLLLVIGTARAGEGLPVRLDPEGPYLVLTTESAAGEYEKALAGVRALHPGLTEARFDPAHPEASLPLLQKLEPRYVLIVAKPAEIDVNLAWQWLAVSASVDEDPFVDLRTGFLTGENPEAVAAFVGRIAAAVKGELSLPRKLVDDVGPNLSAPPESFFVSPFSFLLKYLPADFPVTTISHGRAGFTKERIGSLGGAGVLHFGGHGYPDRIVQGFDADRAAKLELSPCVVFNGACYTGVTDRWYFDGTPEGKVAASVALPGKSFALRLLTNNVVGYLAALHPDHGIPVYQEMEHLFTTGASLGDVIRHTQNGIVLAAGGKLPVFPKLSDGAPASSRVPSEIMLRGTAARILFGDPALIVTDAVAKPALVITAEGDEVGVNEITAWVENPALKATLADTYHSDLCALPNLFNDRALIKMEWWSLDETEGAKPAVLEVLKVVTKDGKELRHRLVGWGMEQDGKKIYLHAQVDIESTAWLAGPFRHKNAQVHLRLTE